MTTITAILEPAADGTVHVPVPADMPQGLMKVTATFESSWNPTVERAVRARRLLGAGRKFFPHRDSGAELAAERASEG